MKKHYATSVKQRANMRRLRQERAGKALGPGWLPAVLDAREAGDRPRARALAVLVKALLDLRQDPECDEQSWNEVYAYLTDLMGIIEPSDLQLVGQSRV